MEQREGAVADVGLNPDFWRGRRVLVTGHTGFKGSWLVLWLRHLGAHVVGVSSRPPTDPSLYRLARAGEGIEEIGADVRDFAAIRDAVAGHRPDVIMHLAAQALVRRSFRDPLGTYETNVMGTVNVLEAVRQAGGSPVVLTVTSDKCYENREQGRPFVEDDPMGGNDPYSNSKGCAELVANAYRASFFSGESAPRVASARAGNVIGGGDWGEDRLVPDIMRAAIGGGTIRIRNPESVRPWQHVLNPLGGYLKLCEALADSPDAVGGWNFGPDLDDVRPVRWIVEHVARRWPEELAWEYDPGPHPREAMSLVLDSTKAREQLGWSPLLDIGEALDSIVEWYLALRAGEDMRTVTLDQIERAGAVRARAS